MYSILLLFVRPLQSSNYLAETDYTDDEKCTNELFGEKGLIQFGKEGTKIIQTYYTERKNNLLVHDSDDLKKIFSGYPFSQTHSLSDNLLKLMMGVYTVNTTVENKFNVEYFLKGKLDKCKKIDIFLPLKFEGDNLNNGKVRRIVFVDEKGQETKKPASYFKVDYVDGIEPSVSDVIWVQLVTNGAHLDRNYEGYDDGYVQLSNYAEYTPKDSITIQMYVWVKYDFRIRLTTKELDQNYCKAEQILTMEINNGLGRRRRR